MWCFGNPIVVSGSILYNILYCIVELFSLIRGRKHGWPNHIKTSCTVCVIVLSLCSWTNIVGIKAFAGTTRCSRGRDVRRKKNGGEERKKNQRRKWRGVGYCWGIKGERWEKMKGTWGAPAVVPCVGQKMKKNGKNPRAHYESC